MVHIHLASLSLPPVTYNLSASFTVSAHHASARLTMSTQTARASLAASVHPISASLTVSAHHASARLTMSTLMLGEVSLCLLMLVLI